MHTLSHDIAEGRTAKARLHSFIGSTRQETDSSMKMVQEEGYYNTELRGWIAQLAKFEAELVALKGDVRDLLCISFPYVSQIFNMSYLGKTC